MSRTLIGIGLATTRRGPLIVVAISQSRTMTSSALKIGPTGFVGSEKASSLESTSTRVKTTAVRSGRWR